MFWNSWRHCFVIQSLCRVPLFSTAWSAACPAALSFIISWCLPIESMMPSSHFSLCYPLLLLSSIFPRIRVFSNESALHIRWKYWSFSFSISPMLHDLDSSQLWVMKKRSNYIHFVKWWEMHHYFSFNRLCIGASQVVLVVKNPRDNAGHIRNASLIPGLGRSPGGGHGNPLPHSCLENPMDRVAWWTTVYGVAQSQTQLKQLSTHVYFV